MIWIILWVVFSNSFLAVSKRRSFDFLWWCNLKTSKVISGSEYFGDFFNRKRLNRYFAELSYVWDDCWQAWVEIKSFWLSWSSWRKFVLPMRSLETNFVKITWLSGEYLFTVIKKDKSDFSALSSANNVQSIQTIKLCEIPGLSSEFSPELWGRFLMEQLRWYLYLTA